MVLSALLAEGALRLFFDSPPTWKEPQVRHLESPLLGWVLPAGTDNFFTIDQPVSTNSAGLRDDEIPVAKPPGELRVLALGDSFTFALGVAFEDLWVQRLERRLRSDLDGGVEVINAGVAGYNTRQELIYLLSEGLSWDPDVIVVAFYWNDLLGNEQPLPDLRTTPRLASEGDVLPADRQSHTIPRWLRDGLRQSLLVYLSTTRLKALVARVRGPQGGIGAVQRAILEGDAEALAPYFRATEERLAHIARVGSERGIPVVLVYFPMENQVVHPEIGLHLADWLREFWRGTGFPFVDLSPSYVASRQDGENPFLAYDLHPNATGMEIAARMIHSAIAPLVERKP